MNEVLNQALLDLQDSLGAIDNWADLLQKNQETAAGVMQESAVVLKQLEQVVVSIEQETQKILDHFQKRTDKTLEEIEALLMQYQQLAAVTAELVDYLRSVNFPARLDKIDASVSAITLGVQNLSDKVDRHRDQLISVLEKGWEENNKKVQELQLRIQSLQGRQNVYFGITASLIFIVVVLLLIQLIWN